jgi:MFS family permease
VRNITEQISLEENVGILLKKGVKFNIISLIGISIDIFVGFFVMFPLYDYFFKLTPIDDLYLPSTILGVLIAFLFLGVLPGSLAIYGMIRIKKSKTHSITGISIIFLTISCGFCICLNIVLMFLGSYFTLFGSVMILVIITPWIMSIRTEIDINKLFHKDFSISTQDALSKQLKINTKYSIGGYVLILMGVFINSLLGLTILLLYKTLFGIIMILSGLSVIFPLKGIFLNLSRMKAQKNEINMKIALTSLIFPIFGSGIGPIFFYFNLALGANDYFKLDSYFLPYFLFLVYLALFMMIIGNIITFAKELEIKKSSKLVKESLKKLSILLQMTDSIKIDYIAKLLNVKNERLIDFLNDNRDELGGFVLEKNIITVKSQDDINKFINLLNEQFESWNYQEKSKNGKI